MAALSLAACGGGSTEPTGSTVHVIVATTGAALPMATTNFTVTVYGASPRSVSPNGSLDIPGLSAGNHAISITGVPSSCTLAGNAQRTVTLGSTPTDVLFAVNCPGMLAFEQTVAGNGLDIIVLPGDGSGTPRTVVGTSFVEESPAWSPDGQKIAFQSIRNNLWDLFTVPAAGGAETQLTTTADPDGIDAVWSPDGQRMALSLWNGSTGYIELTGPSGRTPFSPTTLESTCAAWSPNGTTIAFSGRELVSGARTGVYVMRLDGTGLQRLTASTISSYCPRWSPDGTRLAFHAEPSGSADLFVINRDGTGLQAIAPGEGDDEYPDWSPDGRHLAFSKNLNGQRALYIVEVAANKTPQLIPQTQGGNYPRWRAF
jgi:Tol biopolymer transport system component